MDANAGASSSSQGSVASGASSAGPAVDGANGQADGLSRKITKQAAEWLSLRQFDSTSACIEALRAEDYE
eukprot:1384843-Prymnesium_polylepis.1